MLNPRSLAAAAVAFALYLLAVSTRGPDVAQADGPVAERRTAALARKPVDLGGEYTRLEVLEPKAGRVELRRDPRGVISSVQLPAGRVRLCMRKPEPATVGPGGTVNAAVLQTGTPPAPESECAGGDLRSFDVIPTSRPIQAALGTLLLILFLPVALGSSWGELVADTNGKPSLAAVQLLIWFVPGAVMLAALSLPQRTFPELDSSLALLLGLSGGTALLSSAATKTAPAPAGGTPPPPSGARALVANAGGQGEISRYQLLVVSIVGAATLLAAFWYRLEIPRIPPELVALIGASQATYVGAKAVDALK